MPLVEALPRQGRTIQRKLLLKEPKGKVCGFLLHTRLSMYIYRPFQYDCTSRWPYELVLVAIAKGSGFFAMCVGYDGKVLSPLWFVHEDSHLVDETM